MRYIGHDDIIARVDHQVWSITCSGCGKVRVVDGTETKPVNGIRLEIIPDGDGYDRMMNSEHRDFCDLTCLRLWVLGKGEGE